MILIRIQKREYRMAHAGQFGIYYTQIIDRFYHALEWRYNDVKEQGGREADILARLLDVLLADQIGHDIHLHNVEKALREFQRVRHDSFTPNKYKEIVSLMGIDEEVAPGYQPQLFGHVQFEARYNI